MPTETKTLKPEDKKRILEALTATPTKQKDMTSIYNELNTQTNNTTENDKHRINRANIG